MPSWMNERGVEEDLEKTLDEVEDKRNENKFSFLATMFTTLDYEIQKNDVK